MAIHPVLISAFAANKAVLWATLSAAGAYGSSARVGASRTWATGKGVWGAVSVVVPLVASVSAMAVVAVYSVAAFGEYEEDMENTGLIATGQRSIVEFARRWVRGGAEGVEYAGVGAPTERELVSLVDGLCSDQPIEVADLHDDERAAAAKLPTQGFVRLCVAEVRVTMGLPRESDANRKVARDMLISLFKKRKMRPAHMEYWIDMAVESIFVPSQRQIKVRALTADRGVQRRKRAYVQMRKGVWWWSSSTIALPGQA